MWESGLSLFLLSRLYNDEKLCSMVLSRSIMELLFVIIYVAAVLQRVP